MADAHVISALNRKYAQLTGELRKAKRETARLRRDVAHVEATIRLFRADWAKEGVASIAPIKPSRWGGRGTGLRLALGVLRDATEPLTARQITTAAVDAGGIALPDSKALSAVAGRTAACLERRIGSGVVRHDGRPPRWSVER